MTFKQLAEWALSVAISVIIAIGSIVVVVELAGRHFGSHLQPGEDDLGYGFIMMAILMATAAAAIPLILVMSWLIKRMISMHFGASKSNASK